MIWIVEIQQLVHLVLFEVKKNSLARNGCVKFGKGQAGDAHSRKHKIEAGYFDINKSIRYEFLIRICYTNESI